MKFILVPLALLVVAGVYLLRRLSAGAKESPACCSCKLVIIVRDQEPWIEDFIHKLYRAVKNARWVKVLVVDDCSRDGTAEVLRRLQRYYPFEFLPAKAGESAGGANAAGAESAFSGARCFDLRDLEGKELLHAPLFCYLSRFCAGKSRVLSK